MWIPVSDSPLLVRKKSGELVKPALRSRAQPASIITPIPSKIVRFDSHQLEHIQPFFQSSSEGNEGNRNSSSETSQGQLKWERLFLNFPTKSEILQRLSLPTRLERLSISPGNLELIGSVIVRNLAFHKVVIARYTLDEWRTTSDVAAEFNAHAEDLSKISATHDRFTFNIELPDQANLEMRTLALCVKYCVNGEEHWDNNNSANFRIGFRRKTKQHVTDKDVQRLPLQTIPISIDASPGKQYVNDSSPWFEPNGVEPSSQNSLAPCSSRLNRPTFGNRYSFDASLFAAGSPRAGIAQKHLTRNRNSHRVTSTELLPSPGPIFRCLRSSPSI